MKVSLNNPFKGREGYNCFGCSPDNAMGLQMHFEMHGEDVYCEWQPKQHFEGWHNVLHGGIQTTLMDEIASWWVFVNMKTTGVTSSMEVKFKKPVYTDKGPITLIAKKHEVSRNIAVIFVQILDSGRTCCAESYIHYFTYNEQTARERFNYPGFGEFVKETD